MTTLPLDDIQIRDPFVLTVPEESAYYSFASTDPGIWSGPWGSGSDATGAPISSSGRSDRCIPSAAWVLVAG